MSSNVTVDRWQFTLTVTFHYLFPILTMRLALFIAWLETVSFFGRDGRAASIRALIGELSRRDLRVEGLESRVLDDGTERLKLDVRGPASLDVDTSCLTWRSCPTSVELASPCCAHSRWRLTRKPGRTAMIGFRARASRATGVRWDLAWTNPGL
jgi:bd-type cytochrome oxidase subunit I